MVLDRSGNDPGAFLERSKIFATNASQDDAHLRYMFNTNLKLEVYHA